jgi:hypothetical protein
MFLVRALIDSKTCLLWYNKVESISTTFFSLIFKINRYFLHGVPILGTLKISRTRDFQHVRCKLFFVDMLLIYNNMWDKYVDRQEKYVDNNLFLSICNLFTSTNNLCMSTSQLLCFIYCNRMISMFYGQMRYFRHFFQNFFLFPLI